MGLDTAEIAKSPDAMSMLNVFHWRLFLYLFVAKQGRTGCCTSVVKQVKTKFDPVKLPYDSKELEKTINQLSTFLSR